MYLSDVAALGAFSAAAWQIVGGWYRLRASRNKRSVRLGAFDALSKALRDSAAKGARTSPDWGRGAVETGHAHVVAGWAALSPEARIALVDDLLQLAVLTGQLQDIKAVREGRTKWELLSVREQGAVLAALDGLVLDTLGPALKAAAPQLAQSWLWQVTEAVPMLAEEPCLAEPCVSELSALTKAFEKADTAVKGVLAAQRERHLKDLAAALKPLNTNPAQDSLTDLKNLLLGGLAGELGKPGIERGVHELRTALAALAAEQDGALLPPTASEQAAVREASAQLLAEVDARVAAERAKREAAAAEAAAAARSAHVVQTASATVHWSSGVTRLLQLALVDTVLAALSDALASGGATAPLVDAARKLVPKLAIPDAEQWVSSLLAALTPETAAVKPIKPLPAEPAARSPAEEAEGIVAVEGDGEEAGLAPPPPPSPQEAVAELAALVAALPAPGQASAADLAAEDADAVLVRGVVAGALSRVVGALTPGGILAAAAAGAASVQRADVVAAVVADAARKAEAARKPLLAKLEAELPSLRIAAASDLLKARIAELGAAPGEQAPETDTGAAGTPHRLALVGTYIREVVLLGPDAGLGPQLLPVLDCVRPEVEGAVLSSGGTAALLHTRGLISQVALAQDLSTSLQLGPGLVGLLRRLHDYITAPEPAPKEEPASPPADEADDGQHVANGATPGADGNGPRENGHGPPAPLSGAPLAGNGSARDPAATEARAAAAKIVQGLLQDGVVLLELSAQESRKLTLLRIGTDGCVSAGSDEVLFNRHLTTLRELSSQLGPIMTSLDAKADSATGAAREVLAGLRGSAVKAYRSLQELLRLEGEPRTTIRGALSEAKEAVYGLKAAPSTAGLEAGLGRLEGVREQAETAVGVVAGLPSSEDAVSELMVLEEQVSHTAKALRVWSDWVRLRELALGVTPASAAATEEGADIELPPVAELQELLAEEGLTFIDLYGGLGGAEGGGAGDEDGVDEADTAAASTRTQGDGEAAAAAAEAATLARIEGYQAAGQRLIARGQVAVVLALGGPTPGGPPGLRALTDVGLPSTKSPLQLFAEKLLKSELLAAAQALGPGAGILRPLDWYILCPSAHVAALRAALEAGSYWGLQPAQVVVVPWDPAVPALTADLKVAMEAPGRVAKSGLCTGDVWGALKSAGALNLLRRRGARFVDVHTLDDNLLTRPADPVFIGCCVREGLDAAAKVGDPVDLLHCFEGYANMVATARLGKAFSRLVPALGHYCFSANFVKQVDAELRRNPLALYRLAPAAPARAPGAAGPRPAQPSPAAAVAYHLTRHLSDWVCAHGLPGLSSAVLFVDAASEFSPAYGTPPLYVPPSPTSGVDHTLLVHTSWVEASGGLLEDPQEGVVEVAPLVSYAGEGLEEVVDGKLFAEAYELTLQGYAPAGGRRLVVPNALVTAPVLALWLGLAAVKLAVQHKG